MAFCQLVAPIDLVWLHVGLAAELGACQDEGVLGECEEHEGLAGDDPHQQRVEVGADRAGGGHRVVQVDQHEQEGEEQAKAAGHHVWVDQKTHPADHDHEGAGGKVGGQVHPRVSLQGDVEP